MSVLKGLQFCEDFFVRVPRLSLVSIIPVMPHIHLHRSYMDQSIFVALCKSDLVWDYSIKLQVLGKFEENIPIELQQILWKDL